MLADHRNFKLVNNGAGTERRNESAKMMFLHLRRNITGAPKNQSAEKTKAPKNKKITFISYFLLPNYRLYFNYRLGSLEQLSTLYSFNYRLY